MVNFLNRTGGLTLRSALVVFLLIIPVLLSIQSLELINKRDKNWYGGGYDPSYAYLYNSLNVARFRVPGHHDHPGTPMQIIGAVVLQSAWLMNPYGGETLTEAVIKQPEHYLKILNSSVAILGSVSLLILGLFLFWSTKNIWYALLLQAIPFISNLILYNGFVRITQESVLMISCLAMAAFTLHWYFNNKEYSEHYFIKGFGIISGFGIASKLTFLPLMLIPFVIYLGKKQRIKLLKVTAVTFIICTIPIILRYPNMGWWFIKLFIFSGLYGTGKIQVIEPTNYIQSLKDLFSGEPLYMKAYLILTLFLIVSLLIKKFKAKPLLTPAYKVLIAIFLVQTAGFLITAKHPKLSYLLPYECITPVAVIIMIHIFNSGFKNKMIIKFTTALISVYLIIITINYGRSALGSLFDPEDNQKYEQAWQTALNLSKGGAIIGVNPGSSPIAATFFSNVYSRDRYSQKLSEIYPDYYIFDTYGNRLISWNYDTISLGTLAKKYHNRVVIVGENLDSIVSSLTKENPYTFKIIPIHKTEVAVLANESGIKEQGQID